MREDVVEPLLLGLVLIAVSGYVDAIGYLRLGHVFVSFVSGDSTQFSVAIGRRDWSGALAPGAIVGLFLAGVIAGRLIALATGRWHRLAVPATVAALLTVAMTLDGRTLRVMVPMALAMGIQNAVLLKTGQTRIALTYVTGTVVSLGNKLVDAFIDRVPEARQTWVPYALLWLSLTAGAVSGAIVYQRMRLTALAIPIGVLIVSALTDAVLGSPGLKSKGLP